MIFSKRSALFVYFGATIAAGILFAVPREANAAETSLDWINGTIHVAKESDYDWVNGDEGKFGNIPCEPKDGYAWAWQSNGWNTWKVKSTQNECAVVQGNGYAGFRRVLPFGSEYWQQLDLSQFSNPWTLPNPGTNGLGVITNSPSSPSELYYTPDAYSLFGTYVNDGVGNVVRSANRNFEHKLTYPDGRPVNITTVSGVSYSANGRWMYVDVSGVGQLRVDVNDFSVLSFAAGFIPQYAVFTAISNSGNTVVTHAFQRGLKLYDLSHCNPEQPDYGSRECASRDITEELRNGIMSTLPDPSKLGWVDVKEVKFVNESELRLLTYYVYDGQAKSAYMTINTAAPDEAVRYLALGDSFSSGEGAYDYRSVTNFYADENNYNLCHQSLSSYSYLLKNTLSPDWFGAVACSGAVQDDVNSKEDIYISSRPQAKMENINPQNVTNIKLNLNPGYVPQLSFVDKYKPSVATISIGGNDIGFGDIVTACIVNKFFSGMQPCSANRFDREQVANSIDAQIPNLITTLNSIKQNMAGDAKVYVVGYPKIVNYTNMLCSLNTPMEQTEREFADNLIDYLNEAIRIASTEAGVRFLDMSSAFVNPDHDYRLCGNDEQKAVNGLTTESNSNRKPGEFVAHESFHPNRFGHSLLAEQIRLLSNDFTLKMPTAVRTSSVPSVAFRTRLVGDAIVTNTNQTVNFITDSIPNLVVGAATQTLKIVAEAPGIITQNITATVELHSTPVTIGQATVGLDNSVIGSVSIPNGVSPGYHQLHILYTDSAGQEYDLYKYVLVISSTDDFDGDGVKNDVEPCVVGDGSGVDSDKDGIDDACDGEYVAVEQSDDTIKPNPKNSMSTGVPFSQTQLPRATTISVAGDAVFESYAFASVDGNHQNTGNGLNKITSPSSANIQSRKNASNDLFKVIGIVSVTLATLCLCFMMVKTFRRSKSKH